MSDNQDFKYIKNLFIDYEQKIKQLTFENSRLKEENQRLMSELTLLNSKINPVIRQNNLPFNVYEQRSVKQNSFNFMKNNLIIDKIKLFRSIFYGREDVYAIRLEKDGQAIYSPSRYNEKQSQGKNHQYIPMSDKVIYDHLAGNQTIGLYPLRLDQKCAFLVLDFDKEGWQKDINIFVETCHSLNLPVYIERSRSGSGGHTWLFFNNPIFSKTARELGYSLLTHAKALNPRYQFKSFDRMFPNQDVIPKGGFGNLIALPLQKQPLQEGNSAFIDQNFNAYKDQWLFLKEIKKIDEKEVLKVINQIKNLEINTSKIQLRSIEKEPINLIKTDIPSFLEITYSNGITIPKDQLTSKFRSLLYNISSFNNPEFYRKEALRKSTYNTPRVISLYKDYGSSVQLPRGIFEQLCEVIDTYKIPHKINYNWCEGKYINVGFRGQLKAKQEKVVEELLKKPTGILNATTGFGKTVIAAAIIGKLKTNTLIILNKRSLLDQWVQQLKRFLDIDSHNIGQYSGLSKKRTGLIDVALIQSLNYNGNIPEFLDEYGLVLVDECHHASSIRYEQLINLIKAKYVYGLTATLIRKDGHHPIVKMLLGDVRYNVDAIEEQQFRNVKRVVKSKKLEIVDIPTDVTIQNIYQYLLESTERNEIIIKDILIALELGKVPLVITERRQHLEVLSKSLEEYDKNIYILCGRLGKKNLKETLEKMKNGLDDKGKSVVLATGKFIGEGFDEPRLDTLFLTMPISWKGILQQYIGRLERECEGKHEVIVYDYVDQHPVLERMFNKRKKGYKEIGFKFEEEIKYDNLFLLD